MKKQIVILTVLICVVSSLHAQRLWNLSLSANDYVYVGTDTTVSHLRQLVLNQSNEMADRTARGAAINILACNGGAFQQDFLLEQLRMPVPLDAAGSPISTSSLWWDYFNYQRLRGYYGDLGALAGMDSVARIAPESNIKLQAVCYLSVARLFKTEYFEFLRQAYQKKPGFATAQAALVFYGSDLAYRTEAGNLMENVIRDSVVTVAVPTARSLAEFDKLRAISLMRQRFESSEGHDRYQCFVALGSIDPEGQAERSVWAIPRELDETSRSIYFPSYGQYVAVSGDTVRFTPGACYLTAGFVKFTNDWLQHEISVTVRVEVKHSFLRVFKPLPPSITEPVLQVLDSLVGVKAQVAAFGWLADQAFVSELNTDLERAHQSMSLHDSITCARSVRSFQSKIDFVYKDSLNPDPRMVTAEGWKFLYYNAQYILDRLPAIPPSPVVMSLSPSTAYAGGNGFSLTVKGKSFVAASAVLWNGSSRTTTFVADSVLQATILASDIASPGTASIAVVNPGNDTSNALSFTITQPPSGLSIKLINSAGANLTGGALQYYDGSWKDAVNNNDGTFHVNTTLATVSLRMTYEGGSQTKSNVAVGPDVVVFQTVNTQVKLQNSTGALIDTGTVQYYYSSWKAFGHTMNGVATAELLSANYTFRMSYATATSDKQQNIGTNPTVVFQTVNTAVQLLNSQGTPIDTGTVQYYFNSWQALGNTVNGVARAELLPANYTFRMGYASATKDKQQNIGTNPTVVFNTVNATVQLKNSLGAFIDQGTVQYYFSSWKAFGHTINGVAMAELLPASYTFRMAYATVTNDKVQDISTNSTVSFSTVLCTVTVKNGQGQPVDGAQVSYYFSSWVPIGATVGGQVTKELLPASLTFRETMGSATQNKVQNIGTNALVEFVTQ